MPLFDRVTLLFGTIYSVFSLIQSFAVYGRIILVAEHLVHPYSEFYMLRKITCTWLNQTAAIVFGSSSPNWSTKNSAYRYRAQADTEDTRLGLFPDLSFYRALALQEEIRSHETKVVR